MMDISDPPTTVHNYHAATYANPKRSESKNSNQDNSHASFFPWFYYYVPSPSISSTVMDSPHYHRRTTTTTASSTSSSDSSLHSESTSFLLTLYVRFLCFSLLTWILYLLLPRGIRRRYCRADRRRFARHRHHHPSMAATASSDHRSNSKNQNPYLHNKSKGETVVIVPEYDEQNSYRESSYSVNSTDDSRLESTTSHSLNISIPRIRMNVATVEPREVRDPVEQQRNANTLLHPNLQWVNPSSRRNDQQQQQQQRFDKDSLPMETLVSLLKDISLNSSSTPVVLGEKTEATVAQTITAAQSAPTTSRGDNSNASAVAIAAAIQGDRQLPLLHPAIPRNPSYKILSDTFTRLESSGIRLMAHGIQCESKRVWIRVVFEALALPHSYAMQWHTEVSRTITSVDGRRVSHIWVKRPESPSRTLFFKDVLYIDVGKNTSALRHKTQLDPHTCFSLLTATGSLDLQTRSSLERDAIVCCIACLLDQVHNYNSNGVDWRHLYRRDSPQSSTCSSVEIPPCGAVVIGREDELSLASVATTDAALAPSSVLDDAF